MNQKLNTLEFFDLAARMRRRHETEAEAQFVAQVVAMRPPTKVDAAGNIHWDLRKPGTRTLFVAHTDSVARLTGTQEVVYLGKYAMTDGNDVLGADDAAGMAVLWSLMNAKVPGYYVFTRGEECGGVGAKYLAGKVDFLSQFDRAIAFDRKGTTSIITHQGGVRTASDEFAEALATQFSEKADLLFMPDDGGIYTDTEEFKEVIPECTNISVGYEWAHTPNERQDIAFLSLLGIAACKIDWESLPKRDLSLIEDEPDEGSWDDALRGITYREVTGIQDAMKLFVACEHGPLLKALNDFVPLPDDYLTFDIGLVKSCLEGCLYRLASGNGNRQDTIDDISATLDDIDEWYSQYHYNASVKSSEPV